MQGQTVIASSANLALGAALVGLALLVAWRSTERRAVRVPLATYLFLVGTNYGLDGLGKLLMLQDQMWPLLRAAALTPIFLDPPMLLLFALATARQRITVPRVLMIAGPGLFLLGLFLTTPAFTPGINQWPHRVAYTLLLGGQYLLAFALVVDVYLKERQPVQRDRLATLVVALGAVVLPRLALFPYDLGIGAPVYTLANMVQNVSGIVFAYGILVAWVYVRTPVSDSRHVRRTLASLGTIMMAVACMWTLLVVPVFTSTAYALLFSVRWYLFAAIVLVGIRHYGLFGIPEEDRRWVRLGGTGLLVALPVAVLNGVLLAIPGTTPSTAFPAALAATLVGLILYRAFSTAVPLPPAELEWRRQALYRAHVELGKPPDELARLRARLRLTEDQAREIELLVGEARAMGASAPDPGPRVGETFLDRYEVKDLLAVTRFARTYVAWDPVQQEHVVLKEVDAARQRTEAEARQFFREAETALSIAHPNVVRFRSLERAGSSHVLVLEHVRGETLRARLRRGPLSTDQAARVGRDLLAGLAALHDKGIVHRDVKPENVILHPSGRAVLLDFGAAMTRQDMETLVAGPQPHPGTPGYMSPEQRAGGQVTPRTDLYAVAVTLWECLTGERPLEGDPPAKWRGVLQRALADDPQARWPDAASFAQALPGPSATASPTAGRRRAVSPDRRT